MFEESSVCADSRVDGKELEDGEFAISRNYFDFEGIGPIESDVEPCDEVQAQKKYDVVSGPTSRERFWSFVTCMHNFT